MDTHQIRRLAEAIKSRAVDNHLTKITLAGPSDLLFSLSRERGLRGWISLNNNDPFMALSAAPFSAPSLVTPFYLGFRKLIDDTRILDVAQLSGDRIIQITLEGHDHAFEPVLYHLYAELIPHHPNLILTDHDDRILTVFRPSTTLDALRPLAKGLVYQAPEKPGSLPIDDGQTPDMESLVARYLPLLTKARHRDRYQPLFTFVKNQIASRKRKLQHLEDDIRAAEDALAGKRTGQRLLGAIGSLEITGDTLDIEGDLIAVDPHLSLAKNAEKYFAKYRKGQAKKQHAEAQKALTEEALTYFENLALQLDDATDDDLAEIAAEVLPFGFAKGTKAPKKAPAIAPYFVTYQGIKIGFGHNNLQNDQLTFRLAKPTHWFLHLKGDHGAHVIIFDDHPSDAVKEAAAEIALYLSHLEDGEVLITQKRSIRKLTFPGQVRLDHYQSYRITQVSEDIKKLVKSAHR